MVLVNGARQAGKRTLTRLTASAVHGAVTACSTIQRPSIRRSTTPRSSSTTTAYS